MVRFLQITFMLFPLTVRAGMFENPLTGQDSLLGVACAVTDGLVPFMLVLGTMAIMASAALYFISGGDERRVTQAKRALYVGVIGMIIAMLSYGFPSIIAELFKIDPSALPPQC